MTLKPSAFRPRKQNSHRADESKRCPQYLQWLRGRKCAIDTPECGWNIEAAHCDHGGDKGMSTKPSDRFAIPLCGRHHDRQHTLGRKTFEARYKIDMLALAAEYWRAWPGRVAFEAKQ